MAILIPRMIQSLDGWIPDSDAWVYVSATSFKVVGKNVTSKFQPGTKIAWNQTTTRYAYVVSSAFSTNTTVTITGGDDYAVSDATILYPCYSYANPPNFPEWFNYTETWSGFSTAPSGGKSRFKIDGRLVIWNLQRTVAGTSNNASHTVSLPTTAKTLTGLYWNSHGHALDNVTWTPASLAMIESGGTVAILFVGMSLTWQTSCDSRWVGPIMYEI